MVTPPWVNRDYLTTIDMAICVLAAFRQPQHVVKSLTLNLYTSLFNLKLCKYLVNKYQSPLTLDFFGPSWSELSPYG